MTNSEFIKLSEELLRYNGKVNNVSRQAFIRRLKQSPDATNQARALFGERGVYDASNKDINQFIADTTKITARGIDKTKYQDYSKVGK